MRFRYALLPALLGLATACGRGTDPHPDNAAWRPLAYDVPALAGFSEVHFASAQVGWVIGGYVADQYHYSPLLTTRDGGATWTRQNLYPLTLAGFRTLMPVSERLVFAVGVDPVAGAVGAPSTPASGQAVYKSTDGGANWQLLPGGGFLGSFRLHFFDEQTGLSFKNNAIQRTTDGGASWRTVFQPQAGNWNWVQFPTAAVGYAAGGYVGGGFTGGVFSNGNLAKTTDQGATWQALPWAHQYINSLSFVGPTVGFAATYPDQHLYKTQDGGTTWQLVNAELPASGRGHFVSEQEGYLADGPSIYHSADGGLTWQEEYRTVPNSQYSANINGLDFPTPTAGFAVTADGQIIKGTL
ncbi:MAG: WD40/YVTN/BNR-like repeat-containing protein [Janthinobacterium lividum]